MRTGWTLAAENLDLLPLSGHCGRRHAAGSCVCSLRLGGVRGRWPTFLAFQVNGVYGRVIAQLATMEFAGPEVFVSRCLLGSRRKIRVRLGFQDPGQGGQVAGCVPRSVPHEVSRLPRASVTSASESFGHERRRN